MSNLLLSHRLRRHLAPISAALLCCSIVGIFVLVIRAQTGGMFVYPLDDSYIHLVLARTLAAHHVWGVASDHFASASSSPGWTVLLAASDLLLGPRLLTPIYLNLLFVFAVLFAVDAALTSFAPLTPQWFRYATAFTIVLATPLPNLVITGMEHVAQTFTILLVALFAVRILATAPSSQVPARDAWLLCLSALCAGALRYETVFVILPVTAMLFLRGRFRLGLLVAASAAAAPVAFGLFFHHMSGFWLPYSVLAKTLRVPFAFESDPWLPLYLLFGLKRALPLVPVLALLWLVRRPSRSFWEPSQLLFLLAGIVAAEHTLLAPVGWLMRYESYFVCLALTALAVALSQTLQPQSLQRLPTLASLRTGFRTVPRPLQAALALVCLILAIFIPKLLHRVYLGSVNPVMASVDRYNEHIQVARLASSEFDHDTLVVNDIGALAFYSHAHLLDAYGLGSPEPLELNRKGQTFTPQTWQNWAASQNASIAILQIDPGLGRFVPPAWTLVQQWRLPRNIVFGDFTVSFYAIKPSGIPRLCSALAHFPLTPRDTLALNRCPSGNTTVTHHAAAPQPAPPPTQPHS